MLQTEIIIKKAAQFNVVSVQNIFYEKLNVIIYNKIQPRQKKVRS